MISDFVIGVLSLGQGAAGAYYASKVANYSIDVGLNGIIIKKLEIVYVQRLLPNFASVSV